ncbi:aquaporin-like protein [Trematosphaeria pertusa]|uniref:Aquaporin-like protein n=1 Tax=Trematosphaeria pertusa TaxID=390896 RepID=A0A6A6I785_9PLEO|nr:aquaporin-like protein [Trematosphaeria pertusa]KAF2246414.1 aquaporin-like protein [Trematosphaeria pertusa]
MPRLRVPPEPKQHHPEHRRRHQDDAPHSNGRHHGHHGISSLQGHLVAATGEFVGTFMFLYFSFAGQIMLQTQASDRVNGGPSSQTNIFTALLYGFSLLVNVWAFYRISGGLFNPAVTLGMVLTSTLPPIRALFLFPAQLLAGMCAAALVSCMFPGDIRLTNTTLSPGTSIAQGVFIEMFMTAELVFVVLMLAAEKSKDTFIAPIGIGLALFVAMMGGVFYTGGSLNPTRSFGPAVAGRSFPVYHWIYWVGPCLGAVVAAGYFRFVKHFHYEQANPGQDSADGEFVREGEAA